MNNIKTIASGILAAFVGGWALGLSFGLGVPETAPVRDGSLVNTAFGLALLLACYVCSGVLARIAYVHAKA